MEQRPDVVRVEAEPALGGREQPRDVAMGDATPLGSPVEPEV